MSRESRAGSRGSGLRAVRQRYGAKRLRRIARGRIVIVRAQRSARGRTVFIVRKRKVLHVVIAHRAVVAKQQRLKGYLRRAKLIG